MAYEKFRLYKDLECKMMINSYNAVALNFGRNGLLSGMSKNINILNENTKMTPIEFDIEN